MSESEETIDPRVLREAVIWLMRLQSDGADEKDVERLAAWRNRNLQHELAWLRAERLIGTVSGAVDGAPAGFGIRTLNRLGAGRLGNNRRDALKLLALLLMAPPAAWQAFRISPWRDVFAAHYTATGERRELTLVDNSHVILNTDTAIDVNFDAAQRLLVLRRGEMLVTTAPDIATGPDNAVQSRPFLVSTGQGLLHALGTRFMVRQLPDSSRVSVFDGAVAVRTVAGGNSLVINAGEQVEFTEATMRASVPVAPVADGWSRGILYADNQRLGDFLAELARYRAGVLRCDPAIADLRISGTFQLADTDRVLALLEKNHALRIEARTRWWVSVHPA